MYEEHETFAEMTDALGVDVSPQTVRHFMIRHEIHEPSTQSSAKAEDTEEDSGGDRTAERQSDSELPSENGGERSNGKNRIERPDGEDSDEIKDREQHSNDGSETSTTTTTSDSIDGDEQTDEDTPTDRSTDGEIDFDQLDEVPLPDGVSIEDVKEAVQSASTMHEVQRALDLKGSKTRTLLQELDLIDLVTGRLAYKPNQDTSLDEIETATDSTEEIEKRIHNALNSASTSKV